jgi:uncharacterized protein (DUF4415 family)
MVPDDRHNGAAKENGLENYNGAATLSGARNNKLRITISLDHDVVAYFKDRASETAKGYQTLINEALREYVGLATKTGLVTELMERVKRLEDKLID